MWNIAFKKRKIIKIFMLPILKKNLIMGVAAAEEINIEDIVMSGEFIKQQAHELE